MSFRRTAMRCTINTYGLLAFWSSTSIYLQSSKICSSTSLRERYMRLLILVVGHCIFLSIKWWCSERVLCSSTSSTWTRQSGFIFLLSYFYKTSRTCRGVTSPEDRREGNAWAFPCLLHWGCVRWQDRFERDSVFLQEGLLALVQRQW